MEFLPPTSPFFSPVEDFFSAWRRKVYDHQPHDCTHLHITNAYYWEFVDAASVRVLSGITLIPTSTTNAPGFIQFPRMNKGLPMDTTRISASRVILERSRVIALHEVTVAYMIYNEYAMGAATIIDCSTTTICLPIT